MHKKHNSHHIFLYLGLLTLLFILVFGIRYFASEYTYSPNGIEINNSQDYEDGLSSFNPFSERSQEQINVDQSGQQIIPIANSSVSDYILEENKDI